jgi:hypothetical protein
MLRAALLACILLLLSAPLPAANAQCTGRWLPGESIPGVNGPVTSLARLPGGDVIVGGAFSIAGSTRVSALARYTPATATWSDLSGGVTLFNGANQPQVNAIVVLPSGDLLIAGSFNAAGGVPVSSVARYNPATGIWSSIQGSAYVIAMAVLPNGDVVMGGNFEIPIPGDNNAKSVAIYHPDTDLWSRAGNGVTNNGGGLSPGDVYSIVVLPNGDFVVGGRFDRADTLSAANIARFSPATGQWDTFGGLLPVCACTRVLSLALMTDGAIAVAGEFTSAGGFPATNIARFDPSAFTWSPLGPGLDRPVHALLALPQGDLLAGGEFDAAGSTPLAGIARFSHATGAWSSVGAATPMPYAAVPAVNSLLSLADGTVIVGGSFDNNPGQPLFNIAKLDLGSAGSGPQWSPLTPGLDGEVLAITTLPGGDAVVGGGFRAAHGAPANHIARYAWQTGTLSPLGAGTNGYILALATLPGGDIVAGGNFSSAGGVPAAFIARCNPTTGAWTPLGSGTGGPVGALAVAPDGSLIAGGNFSFAGGTYSPSVARYDFVAQTWSALGSGIEYLGVDTLLVLPSGDILAGGNDSSNGVYMDMRYSALTGTWASTGLLIQDSGARTVRAFAQLPSGEIIAGGAFGWIGDTTQPFNIARLPTGGAGWQHIATGADNQVNALAVLSNGQVIAAGDFTSVDGLPVRKIARLNPATSTWSDLGSGPIDLPGASFGLYGGARIWSLAILPGGDILAGGSFHVVGSNVSAYLARWTSRPACPADFDCSGSLSPVDILSFLNGWFANDPAADFNGGGLAISDIFDFLNAWFAGCP